MSSKQSLESNLRVSQHQEDGSYLDHSDEIDLVGLCAGVWEGRWKLVSTILVCLIFAIVYLSITPKTYELETVLSSPLLADLEPLQPSEISVLRSPEIGRYALQSPDVNRQYETSLNTRYAIGNISSGAVFGRIKGYLQSEDELVKFWLRYQQTDSFKTEEVRAGFLMFYHSLSVQQDEETAEVTILYRTGDPDKDVSLIRQLLVYINQRVINEFTENTTKLLEIQRKRLLEDIILQRTMHEKVLADQIAKLKENITIAEAVGIDNIPYQQLANIELEAVDNFFMLGAKALKSQLDVLEKRKGNDAFIPGFRNLQFLLKQIDTNLSVLNLQSKEARTFVVLKPVSRPLKPIGPRRALILALSIVLGGMLGCFWLLVEAVIVAVRKRGSELVNKVE